MALRTFLLVGAAGYFLYHYVRPKPEAATPVAFAHGEAKGCGYSSVRNAGPDAMRSIVSQWDSVDEASDESFPASDPPAIH